MKCLVCQTPNPGNHYSESCCRPCSAFFRRTVKLKLRYKCIRFGDCAVIQDSRYKCRYCRMKKCIEVGMTCSEKPTISFDYRFNESTVLPSIIEIDEEFFSYKNFNKDGDFGLRLVQRLEVILAQVKKSRQFSFSLCQQAVMAYDQYERSGSKCHDKSEISNVFDSAEVILSEWKTTPLIAEFCMGIKPFTELPLGEKSLLLQSFGYRFLTFDRVFSFIQLFGSNPSDSRVMFHNGKVFCRKQLGVSNASTLEESAMNSLYQRLNDLLCKYFYIHFKRLNPDRFEFAYLLLVTLFRENIAGVSIKTRRICQQIRDQLGEELQSYYQMQTGNYACRIYGLQNILLCIDRVGKIIREEVRIAQISDTTEIDDKMYDLCL